MDATDIWGNGHPVESTKDEVFNFLKKNPDQMYEPSAVTYKLTDKGLPEYDGFDIDFTIKMISLMVENAKMQVALERLVDEGNVEKRSFEVDQLEAILQDVPEGHPAREELETAFGDERITESIHYRVASEFR